MLKVFWKDNVKNDSAFEPPQLKRIIIKNRLVATPKKKYSFFPEIDANNFFFEIYHFSSHFDHTSWFLQKKNRIYLFNSILCDPCGKLSITRQSGVKATKEVSALIARAGNRTNCTCHFFHTRSGNKNYFFKGRNLTTICFDACPPTTHTPCLQIRIDQSDYVEVPYGVFSFGVGEEKLST